MWKLVIQPEVKKFVKKLDIIIQKRISKRFNELQKVPSPKRKEDIIDVKDHKLLCKFGIENLRFYYIIFNGKISIEGVNYLGEVSVEHAKKHKSGSFKKWNRQRDFINWIKKKFKKN